MNSIDFFEPDYARSRTRFLEHCDAAGVPVQTHLHPLAHPDGGHLATDVVRLGPLSAKRLLVLTSGVHGPELMAGSACQSGWLRQFGTQSLPPDTAVVLIHAINPWGAAYLRRNNEDNVDLCRNWIDFESQLPINSDYETLHEAVAVDPVDPDAVKTGDAQLERYRLECGGPGLYGALMAGQYKQANGLGFGGFTPTWSRRIMEAVMSEQASQAQRVCMIDYHTGVGPYAYGSIVALQTGESLERAKKAFGGWVIAPNEEGRPADFVPVTGHTTPGYELLLSNAETTAVVLEFGTQPPGRMLELLLADHRETFARSPQAERLKVTREAVRQFFYPSDTHWRQAVWYRSNQVIGQAFEYLARP